MARPRTLITPKACRDALQAVPLAAVTHDGPLGLVGLVGLVESRKGLVQARAAGHSLVLLLGRHPSQLPTPDDAAAAVRTLVTWLHQIEPRPQRSVVTDADLELWRQKRHKRRTYKAMAADRALCKRVHLSPHKAGSRETTMKRSVSRVEAFLRTPAGKALETSRYFQASLSWGFFERDDLEVVARLQEDAFPDGDVTERLITHGGNAV